MISNGPRTAWFRCLSRTVEDLQGHEPKADDTDRFFLAGTSGAAKSAANSTVPSPLAGSHDEQCEGLRVLARLVGASGERPTRAEQSATDCCWTKCGSRVLELVSSGWT